MQSLEILSMRSRISLFNIDLSTSFLSFSFINIFFSTATILSLVLVSLFLQFRQVNLILKIREELGFWTHSSILTPMINDVAALCLTSIFFSLFDLPCSSTPWCFCFFKDSERNQIFTFFSQCNYQSWKLISATLMSLVPELFYFALQKDGPGAPGGQSWTVQWLKFDNSYFKVLCDDDNIYIYIYIKDWRNNMIYFLTLHLKLLVQDIKEKRDNDLLVLPTDAVLFEDPSFKVE